MIYVDIRICAVSRCHFARELRKYADNSSVQASQYNSFLISSIKIIRGDSPEKLHYLTQPWSDRSFVLYYSWVWTPSWFHLHTRYVWLWFYIRLYFCTVRAVWIAVGSFHLFLLPLKAPRSKGVSALCQSCRPELIRVLTINITDLPVFESYNNW